MRTTELRDCAIFYLPLQHTGMCASTKSTQTLFGFFQHIRLWRKLSLWQGVDAGDDDARGCLTPPWRHRRKVRSVVAAEDVDVAGPYPKVRWWSCSALGESLGLRRGLKPVTTAPTGVVFLPGGISEELAHYSPNCGHVGDEGVDRSRRRCHRLVLFFFVFVSVFGLVSLINRATLYLFVFSLSIWNR